MAVILPKNFHGVTSGAAREAARSGYSTADGGLFSVAFIKAQIANINVAQYKNKREPLGIFMTQANETVIELDEVTNAISKAARTMVTAASDANKNLSDTTGKMRDNAEKLGAAIAKLSKIAGEKDFTKLAATAESLVSSLERLAELEKTGMLDRVMKAMSK